MHFLIVLVAIIALESYGQMAFLQRDGWLQTWHRKLSELSMFQRSSILKLLAFVLVPVIVLYLIILQLANSGYGLLVFILELGVLLYSFGRGDISAQIELLKSDIERNDLQAAYHDAAVFNIAHRSSSAESSSDLYQELIAALPYRIFERRFAAVFWFFILGAPAALAYRLLALHGDMALADGGDQEGQESAAEDATAVEPQANSCQSTASTALWLLEWLPVRFLALTLGLVGSFAHATEPLKELIFCPRTSTADLLRRCVTGALGDIYRPQIDAAEDGISEESAVSDNAAGLALISEMVALFTRAMMGWLVVIALLVMLS
ncbi:MAG: regulatory signaling modulator protein AmpE [Porticoccaceae bacterium]|nr:regulatory signaling modulator protein AmpE [Porticoccaceae bacterium]